MKTLFALELKKLTKKRMNIIVITVCLILAGILFYRRKTNKRYGSNRYG